MPLALAAGLIGASALGGALSNRSKTSTSKSSYDNTSTSTPVVPAEQGALYSAMLGNVQKRLAGQTPLYGYEANGLAGINNTFNPIAQSIQNRMVASGQAGGPGAATALNSLDVARGTQAAQFRNSLPLLQNQLDLQNLGAAGTVYGLGPKGQTTTSSGTATGSATTPGNVAGGAFNGIGSALGFLIGQGSFPSMQGPISAPQQSYPVGPFGSGGAGGYGPGYVPGMGSGGNGLSPAVALTPQMLAALLGALSNSGLAGGT